MSEETSGSTGAQAKSLTVQAPLSRAVSGENQEIFVLPRQKSRQRSRERRESRMFLVDGQLCWADSDQAGSLGGLGKRNSSMGLLFGSSMDLSGMSMGHSIDSSGGAGSGSEEAISYRIKWCRENIMQLKRQTWPMEKKLQVLRASKMFIKQHQGELKQSKQAKDVIASSSAIFERYWRHFKREFANFLVIITPWEMRIKKIESHFGSVVASYFTFLRWIFWLNLANSLVLVSFVMVPELIENVPDLTGMRKGELGMQQPLSADGKTGQAPEFNPTLGEMWEFEGFLKFSPIFYGYYSNVEISKSGFWRNPLAFLLSAMLTYLFCFFCISRKLSQNTKLSRIGSKDDEYTFCWTVFVGWDFMIGNSETAYNKTSSLVMNLKEGILEEKEQTKDRDWRLIIRRVLANVLTLMLIVASAYVVTLAVQRSENLPDDASLLQKNELQLVMSGIQFMFPPLFDVIGIIEKYHPRKALSWQLGRILFLDFLNFYTLMFSLFGTVDQMGVQLNEVSGNITLLRKNTTYWHNLFTTTTTTTTTSTTTAFPIVSSSTLESLENISSNSASVADTFTTTTQPTITNLMTQIGGTATTASASTSNEGLAAVNASTILTSVLLASSTMMPSASRVPISPISSDYTRDLATSVTQVPAMTTTSTLMYATQQITGTSSTIAFATMPKISSTTTTTTTLNNNDNNNNQATTTTSTQSITRGQEEEDYPDLGEVLAKSPRSTAAAKRRRRKRRQATLMDERRPKQRKSRKRSGGGGGGGVKRKVVSESFSDSDSEVVQFNVPQQNQEHQAYQTDLLLLQQQQSQRTVYLPPIRDPYRKIGTETASSHPSIRPATAVPMIGEMPDYEEEPMEGRLPSRPMTTTTTTTVAPSGRHHQAKPPGIARPIGGGIGQIQRGSRVQMTKAPARLDDDTNEDLTGNEIVATFATQGSAGTNVYSSEQSAKKEPEILFEAPASTTTDYPNLGPELTTATPSIGLDTSSASDADDTTASTDKEFSSTFAPAINAKSGFGSALAGSQTEFIISTTSCSPAVVVNLTATTETNTLNSSSVSNLKTSKQQVNASDDCVDIPVFEHQELLALNSTFKDKLKTLCWETMFGQEMVKIVVMDLVMTVISAVSFEFMRACFVRYCNRFFFWDLECGFPGYQDFKIAENVLHLVNNQSTVWMGMFFAPGLPAINTVKLAVLMYVRSWAVLTCNIPHETVFKVSKSNNFYYWILLINLLICILPVAYAVTWIRPSWHCGPFGGECRMYLVVTKLVKSLLPPEANSVFKYLTSPGAVIPILISLILIIYYLASTVSSSKEANKELKAQLKKDKEQEAAVPEITSTAIVDQAPATAAPTTTQVAVNQPPVAPNTSASLSVTNPAAATSGQSTKLQPQSETRPKSLLMPPSH